MPSIDLPIGTPIDGAVALIIGGNRGFGLAVVDESLERQQPRCTPPRADRNRHRIGRETVDSASGPASRF